MNNLAGLVSIGLLILAPVSAAPSKTNRQCVQLQVPVKVSAKNYDLKMPRVDNNIDAVDWAWNLETWSHLTTEDRVKGTMDVSDTFKISAQLCTPVGGAKSEILQIATHGLGYDKR
jgi:hypothetical protein